MSEPNGFGCDMLLIDDDPDLLFLLKAHLQLSGFRVETCLNADGLAEKLLSLYPANVLVDISMKNISGVEVCRFIRKDDRFGAIRIFLMSGNPDIKAVAADAGADGYIEKPVDVSTIRKQLQL